MTIETVNLGRASYDGVVQQVDTIHKSSRVSLRPPETGIYGSFRVALKSGIIAANGNPNANMWEFRWGLNSIIAIVRKLRIQATTSTTAFNNPTSDSSFSLFRASGFTAMDSQNATFATFTTAKGQNAAVRAAESQLASDTSASRTNQGGIAIANTQQISAGTLTLGTNPLVTVSNRILASAAAETAITPEPMGYLIDPNEGAAIPPIELGINEGLVLRSNAMVASGTWILTAEVCWDEVDPARYF